MQCSACMWCARPCVVHVRTSASVPARRAVAWAATPPLGYHTHAPRQHYIYVRLEPLYIYMHDQYVVFYSM